MLALKWIRKCPRTNCLNHFSKVTLVHWVFCKYTQRVYLVFSEIFFPHTFFKIKALTREEEKLGHPQKFFFFFLRYLLCTLIENSFSLSFSFPPLSPYSFGDYLFCSQNPGEREQEYFVARYNPSFF